MNGPWTLRELTAQAASALSATLPTRPHGRSGDLADERMIRWYVTIGVVGPPSARRGRVALYGPRHLLQLVAIKRRQAEGHSLAEIQAELAGATDATLREIAALDGRLPQADEIRSTARSEPARRFWAQRPDASATPGRGS